MLTQEQRDKLHKAIDLARSPGYCRYATYTVTTSDDGTQVSQESKPLCLIGQLAVLEGVSPDSLHAWDRVGGGVRQVMNSTKRPENEKLKDYPLDLLERLQSKWDNDSNRGATEHDLRLSLHRMVNCQPYAPTP